MPLAPAFAPVAAPAAQKPGLGKHIAGTLGDFLMQQAGMQPAYAPMLQDQRRTEAEEVRWQRDREARRADQVEQRQWSNEDWRGRQEYERANPAPRAPIVREDNAGNTIEIDPVTGQSRVLHRETTPKMNFISDGMGGGQWVAAPMSGAVAPAPGPAIGAVIPDPRRPGGPARQAPGTFLSGLRGLPGEQVTSTRRSPARNRAVGGVPNSYHLTGQARDSVPPPGMSMSAYVAQLRRLNPNADVINEGDHAHIEPRGR